MIKVRFTSHHLAAWFFLTAFVAAFGLREAHHFGHAHDGPKAHCFAQKGEKHWHDEHFEIDDCSVCAFVFAAAELPVLPPVFLEKKLLPSVCGGFEKGQFSPLETAFISLRGPPVRAFFA